MAIGGLLLGGAGVVSGLLGGRKAEKEAKKARREQEARVAEISKSYDELIAKYDPTGEYGKSYFEQLKTRKQLDVGKTAQQYLRSGIGGVSHADVSADYERGVGRSSRMALEDFLTEKEVGIGREKAQFLSGVQTTGPSYADIAGAYSGIGTGLATILGALKKKKTDVPQPTWAGGSAGYLSGMA